MRNEEGVTKKITGIGMEMRRRGLTQRADSVMWNCTEKGKVKVKGERVWLMKRR